MADRQLQTMVLRFRRAGGYLDNHRGLVDSATGHEGPKTNIHGLTITTYEVTSAAILVPQPCLG